MKKKLFFAAVALVALASCTSDEFVGVEIPQDNSPSESNAIMFSTASKGITRADIIGADAATLLGSKFVVGGFKGASTAASTIVFDNYNVEWTENSAGKTESNTSDWEYVGINFNNLSSIYDASGKQTIKYWDYSQTLYDFVAYSLGQGTPLATATRINPENHSFTLTGTEAQLTNCYVADRVTVEKADFGKEVTLFFRNLAAKVRVALYETIPGYSVKDVTFYTNDTDDLDTDISSNTSATLIGSFNTGGTYTVTYPTTDKADPDFNQAHVALSTDGASSAAYRNTFGTLVYTSAENKEKESGNKYLKRISTDPSFAGTSTYYQTVLPNKDGAVMELRINYKLEAIDGSGEIINIYGAKAYVPLSYTQWLPNYAYTYLFKISDNTNGWTSTTKTDPAGLYPITFDAVVVNSEENTQSTITTVAYPSITTYQKGHNYEDGPEYAASTDDDKKIYVQVMLDNALKGDLATKGKLYTLSADKTEAVVLDALSIQESNVSGVITGRNGLELTEATSATDFDVIPREDDNNISITAGQAASFPATAGTYAYVYDTETYNGNEVVLTGTTAPANWPTGYYSNKECTTAASSTYSAGTYYQRESYIYTAVTMTSSTPSDWSTANLWWKDPNGVTPAGSWDADNEGEVFYKRYTVDSKIYGVKVIKVQ